MEGRNVYILLGFALSRLTGDHLVASLAITLLILSMTPDWWRTARLTPSTAIFPTRSMYHGTLQERLLPPQFVT
jgi:hypothetical protein